MYAYPPPMPADVEPSDRGDCRSNLSRMPAALYLHVPFCLHFCHFCGFVKARYDRAASDRYVDLLCRELQWIGDRDERPAIDAIYFGGGTPSTLRIDQIERIVSTIDRAFDVAGEAEFSFEGEARSLLRTGYLQDLAALGVNRLSFGVQTMRPDLRGMLNLRPTVDQMRLTIERAHTLFDDVCVDMMAGWPGLSNDAQVADMLDCVQVLRPQSIETFRFELLDSSPSFAKALSVGVEYPLPFDQLAELDTALAGLLDRHGYKRSSYTLFRGPDATTDALRYYSAYYGWDGREVIGVGLGAQSFNKGMMRGSVDSFDEYDRRISAGIPPYDTFAPYDPVEKELATWPRRGFVKTDLVQRSSDEYKERVRRLENVGLIRHGDETLHLVDWSYVEPIMHYLLDENVRKMYESASDRRAKDRNIAVTRGTIHV